MPDPTRHQLRLQRVQTLFSWDFKPADETDKQFDTIREIIAQIPELDSIILRFAPKRTLEQFDKVDLAILRQALYELKYTNTPAAVVIDEAIEIAKLLADKPSSGFIHGVLASYVDEMKGETVHES